MAGDKVLFNTETILQEVNNFKTSQQKYLIDEWTKSYTDNNKDYVNINRMIAKEMTGLILNEDVKITVSDDKLMQILDNSVNFKSLNQQLTDTIEMSFALGGGGIEVLLDNNNILLNHILPHNIVPLKWDTDGTITDVALIIDSNENDNHTGEKKYQLIRVHERVGNTNIIRNILYVDGKTATQQQLEERYPGIEPLVIIKDMDYSLFHYVKPNINNNLNIGSPLGISLIANSKNTINLINRVYESLEHNFKIGKKKMTLPSTLLPRNEYTGAVEMPEYGADFILVTQPSTTDAIKDIKVDLQVEEHIKALNKAFEMLSNELGISPHTFTVDSRGSLKTATEVISDNSKTYKTKNHHQNLIDTFIQNILYSIIEIHGAINNINYDIENINIIVDFDDSIVEDRQEDLKYYLTLYNNGMISKKKFLMDVLEYNEEEAIKAIEEINREDSFDIPEVTDLIGINE